MDVEHLQEVVRKWHAHCEKAGHNDGTASIMILRVDPRGEVELTCCEHTYTPKPGPCNWSIVVGRCKASVAYQKGE